MNTHNIQSGLYLVATPIGNLDDITLRALQTLRKADSILCEDTRITGKLLKAYDIQKPMHVYNDHSPDSVRKKIIQSLKSGETFALVSDAGSPLISDPGYKLVQDCLSHDLYVTTIPGPNAVIAGIQLSGLPSDRFTFLGFMPSKQKARHSILEEFKSVQSTLVFYESAARLKATLEDIATQYGSQRNVSVVREITKLYEETKRSPVQDLIAYYEDKPKPKGEIVLIIAPPEIQTYDDEALTSLLKGTDNSLSLKDKVALITNQTGMPRNKIYDLALDIKNR